MKIAVIGAGIAGTLSAYFLAEDGHQVTVIDREPEPAMACTRANGGQISVCNASTWNTWLNVRKGLKWLTQADAPLLIRPKPELAKLKWLAGFMRHVVNGTHEANTIETIGLGLTSRSLYEKIAEREGLQFDKSSTGLLNVYTSDKSFEDALDENWMFAYAGLERKELTTEEVIALDPGLKNFKHLVGGILTESDWTGDPHKFCQQLRTILESRGTQFQFNQEIELGTVHDANTFTQNGHDLLGLYDLVVVSNGHEISQFASHLGDSMNVYPVKGYSITIDVEGDEAPQFSLLDDDRKIVSSRLGDRFRIAGTAELTGVNYDIRRDRIDPLLNWVRENFPNVRTSTYNPWACLRPMNSNMMPIVRRSKNPRVWYHGGHGHLGWTLGAATANQLAEKIQIAVTVGG